jgi:hypothetical protein
MNRTLAPVAAALLLLGLPAAHAQTTIDQNKAMTKGIGQGDSAGFPVTITQPGSYRLMSNLSVPAGLDGIVITAPNVTIDLNGYTIAGPNTCDVVAKTCTHALGSMRGINSSGNGTVVKDGAVNGFAFVGVWLGGRGGVVRQVSAEHNSQTGIVVKDGRIEGSTALNNANGMGVLSGAIVNSVSNRNIWDGFYLNGGLLIGSSAMHNGGRGLRMDVSGGGVRESVFQQNAGGSMYTGANGASLGNNLCDSAGC